MPVYERTVVVQALAADVWAFYQDVNSLVTLSPASAGVRIESADPLPPRIGTTVTLSVLAPPLPGRVTWVAEYVEFHAFDGDAAWFTDVQRSGPFMAWRHTHRFEAVASAGGGDRPACRCVDRIDYALPGGPLAGLADRLIVRRRIDAMFAHRERVLRERFGTPTTTAPTRP